MGAPMWRACCSSMQCCQTRHVMAVTNSCDGRTVWCQVWEVRSNDVDIAVTPSSNKAFIHWHVRGVQKDTQQVCGAAAGCAGCLAGCLTAWLGEQLPARGHQFLAYPLCLCPAHLRCNSRLPGYSRIQPPCDRACLRPLQENDLYGLNLLVFDVSEMLIKGEHSRHSMPHSMPHSTAAGCKNNPTAGWQVFARWAWHACPANQPGWAPPPCRGGGVQAAPAV